MKSFKPVLRVYDCALNIEDISRALKVNRTQVIAILSDGRNIAKWAEHWGTQMLHYKLHDNINNPGFDATVSLGPMGDARICVRVMTKNGIKFQRSAEIGAGRTCTKESLQKTLEDMEFYVVVDTSRFPVLRFMFIDSKRLLRLLREGKLTPTGMSVARFNAWIEIEFAIEPHAFQLSSTGTQLNEVA